MGSNGTLPQRQPGRQLRRLREEAGLTLEETAPKLDWSTSKLNRIETGQQGVDVHGVRSMLDLYDIGGTQWAEIIELTRQARKKGPLRAYGKSGQGYLRLEIDATVVHEHQQLGEVGCSWVGEPFTRDLERGEDTVTEYAARRDDPAFVTFAENGEHGERPGSGSVWRATARTARS